MGKLKGVAVGPCSDVYGFGKTCCFALFGTPQPTFQHWQQLPRELADLLGRCLNEQSPRPAAGLRFGAARPGSADRPPDPARAADARGPRDGSAGGGRRAGAVRAPSGGTDDEARPVFEEVVRGERRRPRSRSATRNRRRRARGTALVVVLVAGILVVGAAAMLLKLGDLSGPRVAQPGAPRPPWEALANTKIAPAPVVPGWPQPVKPAEPIKPEEFKKVLDELEDKPSLVHLRELAGRLAITPPTDAQKQEHDKVLQMRRLGDAGPDAGELARREKDDDILRVSKALNPLLGKDAQRADYKLAGQAMQKWGTEENVEPLIAHVGGTEFGVFDMRIEIAKALAAIGDVRGVAAVAKRLEDHHDRQKGISAALVAFGSTAEPEMIKYLSHSMFYIRQEACKVLKQIGTRESIEPLQRLSTDFHAKGAAAEAIAAISERETVMSAPELRERSGARAAALRVAPAQGRRGRDCAEAATVRILTKAPCSSCSSTVPTMSDGERPPLRSPPPPEALLVCPICRESLPAAVYESHLRQLHRLFSYRGVRRSFDDTVEAMLDDLLKAPPVAVAWPALVRLVRDEHGPGTDGSSPATWGRPSPAGRRPSSTTPCPTWPP